MAKVYVNPFTTRNGQSRWTLSTNGKTLVHTTGKPLKFTTKGAAKRVANKMERVLA